MTPDYDPKVRETIAEAFVHLEAGRKEIGLQFFALARSQALNFADPAALSSAIAMDQAAYTREREVYRTIIPASPQAEEHLVILADSLGLPRPDDKIGEFKGAERTYSGLIGNKYPQRSVTSYCQRFLTTGGAYKLLLNDPDLAANSDVLIHIGLNDCANRMFIESERLSLSLLSKETRNLMVDFTRKYRREILLGLPSHHYTPLHEFRSNLDAIFELLKRREAKKAILTTIILPPARSWPGTPGMNRNFAHYNLEIMNAVHRHNAILFDFDRHVWQAQNRKVLLPDGMHLSNLGHQLFTDKCDPFLR